MLPVFIIGMFVGAITVFVGFLIGLMELGEVDSQQ